MSHTPVVSGTVVTLAMGGNACPHAVERAQEFLRELQAGREYTANVLEDGSVSLLWRLPEDHRQSFAVRFEAGPSVAVVLFAAARPDGSPVHGRLTSAEVVGLARSRVNLRQVVGVVKEY